MKSRTSEMKSSFRKLESSFRKLKLDFTKINQNIAKCKLGSIVFQKKDISLSLDNRCLINK